MDREADRQAFTDALIRLMAEEHRRRMGRVNPLARLCERWRIEWALKNLGFDVEREGRDR